LACNTTLKIKYIEAASDFMNQFILGLRRV